MILAIVMLLAYVPFLFWVIPEARADMKKVQELRNAKLNRTW